MSRRQTGFTIIELLIATTVFSVIMVICLSAFLRVGQLYYKGIYLSRTQEAARNVADDIVNELRLNGNPGALQKDPSQIIKSGSSTRYDVYFMCVGSKRYSFMSNNQVDTTNESATNFGLVSDSYSPAAGCKPPTVVSPVNPTELLGDKMRIVANGTTSKDHSDLFDKCTLVSSNQICDLHIHVDFGDDDLLTAVNTPGTTCNGPLSGSQFCATTDFDTTVNPLQ